MRKLDLLNLVMLAALCAITPLSLRAAPHNWLPLAAYVGMAGLILTYPQVRLPWFDFPKAFRRVYPVVYIALIFDSLADVIPKVHTWRADNLLMSIDRALFGVDPTRYLEGWLSGPVVELLTYAYMIYFLLPFVLLWLLWRDGKLEEINHWACLITIALYANYLLYFVFPAVGPRFHIMHSTDVHGMFFSDFLMSTLNGLEANKFDAFPSAHVNAALVTLYGFARFHRRGVIPVAVVVAAIAVSTVYLRYHYVIDVLSGAALAAAAIAAGEYFYARSAKTERAGCGVQRANGALMR